MKRLLGDTRGAVMAEGVIVLPFFVILLASIIYFHRAYATKISVNSKARSCAWSYAIDGCRKSSLPEGCPIGEIGGSRTLAKVFDVGIEDGSNDDILRETSAFGDALQGVNTVGLTLIGLDEGIVAKPGESVAIPSILGGGSRSISGNYSVMCNERKKKPSDIAVDAYCSISNRLPGCPRDD